MRVHLRLRLRLRSCQIATLCLWDVVLTQRMGIGPILFDCVKLQTKTYSVNGP